MAGDTIGITTNVESKSVSQIVFDQTEPFPAEGSETLESWRRIPELEAVIMSFYVDVEALLILGGAMSSSGSEIIHRNDFSQILTEQAHQELEHTRRLPIQSVAHMTFYGYFKATDLPKAMRLIVFPEMFCSELRANPRLEKLTTKNDVGPIMLQTNAVLITEKTDDAIWDLQGRDRTTQQEMDWRATQGELLTIITALDKRLGLMLKSANIEPKMLKDRVQLVRMIMLDIIRRNNPPEQTAIAPTNE